MMNDAFLDIPKTVRRLRAGFTMVEILVVIAILGILAGTFAVSTASARENAKIVKATAECRALENAIRLYCMTMRDTSDADDGSTDPMSDLGLSNGVQDVSSSLTDLLTKPSSSNGDTIFYEANDRSIRSNRLCDPWGNPYKIRVKKVRPETRDEKDYEIIVPIPGRHRALEPLTTK